MMLTFEHGDKSHPKGHALLYYKDAENSSKLVATYVVVLPVSVDIVKYMPPFLASQAGELAVSGVSAFAFPPVPEPTDSQERLAQLAETRGDDLLFGGTVNLSQVTYLLTAVNDVVQQYGAAYQSHISSLPAPSMPAPADTGSFNVDDVLLEFMSDRERLVEIAKIMGTLRFALDGADQRLVKESAGRVAALAKYLPERYHPEELVRTAKDPSKTGAMLAQLYLDRCYKLLDDDQLAVQELDERIRALRSQGGI